MSSARPRSLPTPCGDAGMENIEIIPTAGHPLVYADWLHAPGKPTVLLYGHYDVQPPDPLELCGTHRRSSLLFATAIIYARGAADDKGQFYMHIKAVEALRAVNGKLARQREVPDRRRRRNRRRIHREVSSQRTPAKLKADVALVSDTALYAEGIPTLCIGLRGLVYMEVEATGPMRDLHSGLYGGAAPNAVFGLIELLAKAKSRRRAHSDSRASTTT